MDPSVAGSMAPPKFDNTLGALLLGGLLAMALWGVTCVQTYHYYMYTTRDYRWMKFLVALLWLLDTFDSALNAHILYFYMVSNYINPLALFKPVCILMLSCHCERFASDPPPTVSNENIALTGGILAISIADLVISLTIAIKAFGIVSFPELEKLSSLMYSTFAAGTGSDLCLAIALSHLLYKSRTGFKRTDGLIRVLMMYTVNTGMIVAIDASLGMITYAAMPNNLIFLGFYLLLSKLYVNAYLASLNARKTLRTKRDEMLSFNLGNVTNTVPQFRQADTYTSITEKRVTSSDPSSKTAVSLLDEQKDGRSSPAAVEPPSWQGQAYAV
ncbi:hypothetical protein CVT24_001321 [Panaeolus cyanescens]|uniref:DUF6534 domain-containing protein n=1 Tax=Panaeolus cyanescens TaxID=181874 RepID=A0A409VTX6_9AGAR|nr:hypothetical protein CVT24_001321 [Panaeolus cyanescens]